MMGVEIETEQALLGACLLNPDVLDVVDGKITAGDFAEPLHAQIFQAFQSARNEGRRFDVSLMKSILGQHASAEIIEGVTVGEYLARLAANVGSVINAPDYARVISESANYRRLAAAGRLLEEQARKGYAAGTSAQIAASVIAELDAVASAAASDVNRRVSVGQAVASAYGATLDRIENGTQTGVTWGLADLDRVTLLYPGELTIAAARPSMGKTTLGLSTCLAAAKRGHGVLFVSLEMGGIALGQRVLSDMCFDGVRQPIPYTDIRDGKLPDDGLERLYEAVQRIDALPLFIEQEPGLTVSQIAARARHELQRMERKGIKLGLLVVDHLGLIAASDRYAGARHLELGAITSALKVLAKTLGIPVLLLCQLSRAVESRENKRPMLSDLRESGRIEEDADTVVLLYREAYYLERSKETDPEKDLMRFERLRECQNTIEFNVAKQRQGATRTVEAFVSMPCNAIRNIARGF